MESSDEEGQRKRKTAHTPNKIILLSSTISYLHTIFPVLLSVFSVAADQSTNYCTNPTSSISSFTTFTRALFTFLFCLSLFEFQQDYVNVYLHAPDF